MQVTMGKLRELLREAVEGHAGPAVELSNALPDGWRSAGGQVVGGVILLSIRPPRDESEPEEAIRKLLSGLGWKSGGFGRPTGVMSRAGAGAVLRKMNNNDVVVQFTLGARTIEP